LKKKYGKNFPAYRIRNFDVIEAAKVVEANQKLYVDRNEGFIGTSLKNNEYISNCSDIDDIIVFFRDGKYLITSVADKKYVGKNILYAAVFKKNDARTIYNVVYRDGKQGLYYMKRFNVTAAIHDRVYDLTMGTPDSRIVYFTSNPNGEAEVIRVALKPGCGARKLVFERDFSSVTIKGRSAKGIILSRYPVMKVSLKQHGISTLGGRKVWFDRDVLRLNYDERGEYLGEFQGTDLILVVLDDGTFYTTDFELSNHYEDNLLFLQKYNAHKIWTAALYDADQKNFLYLKRFSFEMSSKKQNYLGENPNNTLALLSDKAYPRIEVTFGGNDDFRAPLEIEAADFVGVKGFKARGKRVSTFTIAKVTELEPLRQPAEQQPLGDEEEEVEPEETDDNDNDPDNGKSDSDIIDELTGQGKLF
jgi:topoisomerase-4 subunit A